MGKRRLPRMTEPDEGYVHYAPARGADAVTLCGITDFLGQTPGEPTDEPVTCNLCKWIVDHVHRHAKPQPGDHAER